MVFVCGLCFALPAALFSCQRGFGRGYIGFQGSLLQDSEQYFFFSNYLFLNIMY